MNQIISTVPVYSTFWHTDTGQLSTVTAPGSMVWDFDYNALGQTTQYSHPNSLNSVFSYDGSNRMTKIELKDVSTVKESFAYALDKTGNITKKIIARHSRNPKDEPGIQMNRKLAVLEQALNKRANTTSPPAIR